MTALLISDDPELRQQIAARCAAHAPALGLTVVRRANDAAGDSPSLVMLDARGLAGDGAQLDALGARYRQASLMLLAQAPTQDLLMRAMRAGVREVVPLPLAEDSFDTALERMLRRIAPADGKAGRVLAFISCKGGSGATFIAANLGYALSARGERKVLLIDLNPQFGDAALYVTETRPAMTLADICDQIARVDRAFLEAGVLHVTPHYDLLAASEDTESAARIRPEQVETILKLARQCYDLVLLDIGRQIDTVSIRALDNADQIYPVLQLALPDIRDGCRLLDIFRSLGYRRDQLRLIVNRYEKGGRLRLADLESALGAEVVHTVPNDYVAVTDSVNQGVPLLRQSQHSAAARSLLHLAERILDKPEAGDHKVLSRLLGKIFS